MTVDTNVLLVGVLLRRSSLLSESWVCHGSVAQPPVTESEEGGEATATGANVNNRSVPSVSVNGCAPRTYRSNRNQTIGSQR